ncbi:hypothetical protein ACFL6U_03430 [Planctomycetota bacterium]
MKFNVVLLAVMLSSPSIMIAETVGIFSNSSIPQLHFATEDVKSALEAKRFTVEVLPLSSLNASYTNKKVIISLNSDNSAIELFTGQGGGPLPNIGEQGYSLSTTDQGEKSYWVFGSDANGTMYGGLYRPQSHGQ